MYTPNDKHRFLIWKNMRKKKREQMQTVQQSTKKQKRVGDRGGWKLKVDYRRHFGVDLTDCIVITTANPRLGKSLEIKHWAKINIPTFAYYNAVNQNITSSIYLRNYVRLISLAIPPPGTCWFARSFETNTCCFLRPL